MKRARCVGGPLDGRERVSEDAYFHFVQVEPLPIEKYMEMCSKFVNVSSVAAVTHIYTYDGPSGTWAYYGTQ